MVLQYKPKEVDTIEASKDVHAHLLGVTKQLLTGRDSNVLYTDQHSGTKDSTY